jgi:hypothetical protein
MQNQTMSAAPFLDFAPPEYSAFYAAEPGKEPYRLLEKLAAAMPEGSVAVVLGTGYGAAALALALGNQGVSVNTYDTVDCLPPEPTTPSVRIMKNVQTHIVPDVREIVQDIATADLVVIDIEPLDGVKQEQCVERLMQHGFQGIVVCDDIHLTKGMRKFWDWAPGPKADLTHVGHWSGTGAIALGNADIAWVDAVVTQLHP